MTIGHVNGRMSVKCRMAVHRLGLTPLRRVTCHLARDGSVPAAEAPLCLYGCPVDYLPFQHGNRGRHYEGEKLG